MPLIDQINQMKQQGFADSQITQTLAEQGISPLEINQALEQSQIKGAVTGQSRPNFPQPISEPAMTLPSQAQQYPAEMNSGQPEQPLASMTTEMPVQDQLQPSIASQMPPQPTPTQIPRAEAPAPIMPISGPEQTPEYMYPTSQPPEYSDYQAYAAPGIETMSDIAEQIVDEKLSALNKDLGNVNELKTEITKQVEDMDERLKKIEATIDQLQSAILNRIGEYGENLDNIKSEMEMMQNSFSKALNPLIDKSREEATSDLDAKSKPNKRIPKKTADGFEHYLR